MYYAINKSDPLCVSNFLWLTDAKKNPFGRPASKLTISYLHGDVEVPPLSEKELGTFGEELMKRTSTALEKVSLRPPETSPSPENCPYCSVKHLCDTYWKKSTIAMLEKDLPKTSLMDMVVRITGIHGSKSYDAVSVASAAFPSGSPILLRVPSDKGNFRKGDHIRLISVSIRKQENDEGEDEIFVVSMLNTSEAFLISQA